MPVLKDKFISDFHLKVSGSKGWMIGYQKLGLFCPCCKHKDPSRLAFIFDTKSERASFKCVKCGYSSRLEKFLWLNNKKEYITKYKDLNPNVIAEGRKLNEKPLINEKENLEELPEVMLPLLFKRVKYDKYLQERGAKLQLYKHWIIGKTEYEHNLYNYVIFVIQELGRNVGWVARCKHSKEYIDNYNKTHDKKILRWKNSPGSDFAKIVFGLDEITENTKTLIIVEGITSKLKTDCNLNLYNQEEIKCVCTFGKKTSQIQLEKIKQKAKNLNKLILFYDTDAIRETKKYIFEYQEQFKGVDVFVALCWFKNEKGQYKDAGDLNKEELEYCLNHLKTPFDFFENTLVKKSLK